MSKKLNFRTINDTALATLNNYNIAYQSVCKIKARYKGLIETAEKALADIKAQRGEMLQQGFSESEVIEKYPTVEAENKIRKLEVERDEELKPHNEAIREAVKTLPDTLFGAYAFAMEYGISATVSKGRTIEVGKKSYWVEKSFTATIKDIVMGWGLGHADDDKACTKFADLIKGRIAGMKKDNKGGYLALKGQRVLGEMFLLASIQYFMNAGVLSMNEEDYTLSVVVAE